MNLFPYYLYIKKLFQLCILKVKNFHKRIKNFFRKKIFGKELNISLLMNTFFDMKLKENNRELDLLADEEREPEDLNSKDVNTDIDLKSIERALQDIEEQEIENYQESYEEEIRDAEITIEIMEILEDFENMDEEELDEFFNEVPDCLKEDYYWNI